MQKALAKEVTIFVHGEAEYGKAIETTEKLFSNQNTPAESLSEGDLEAIEGIVKCVYAAENINSGVDVISFLVETAIFPSKGEARKMIQNGGVNINRNRIEDVQLQLNRSLLLHNKYFLIQKGKKNYYLVSIV